MSATIGTRLARTICFSAAVLSTSGHETRMMSTPASSQRRIWSIVARGSLVAVLVIVCTVTGASPPTGTLPTMIWRLCRRTMSRQGRRDMDFLANALLTRAAYRPARLAAKGASAEGHGFDSAARDNANRAEPAPLRDGLATHRRVRAADRLSRRDGVRTLGVGDQDAAQLPRIDPTHGVADAVAAAFVVRGVGLCLAQIVRPIARRAAFCPFARGAAAGSARFRHGG